jgi:N-acetylmuramoyl-L-alanine amidase
VLLLGAPALVGGPSAWEPPRRVQAPGRTYDVPSSAGAFTLVSHRKKHPNRKIKRYRVRPGDTPGEIATRYHAWTDELVRMNHGPVLFAGEVIRIPVVVKAAKACDEHRHHRSNLRKHRSGSKSAGKSNSKSDGKAERSGKHDDKKPAKKKRDKTKNKKDQKPAKKPGKKPAEKPGKKPAKKKSDKHSDKSKDKKQKKAGKRDRWKGENASRAEVRRVIIRVAEDRGVNPDLALAISWMESGWQQKRVSSAGALGAMQVMPGTGQWMSVMVGRRLHLRHLEDNVIAGVTLIEWLRSEARLKVAVAGYYQGLAGVRRHGMYRSTKEYVADVLSLKRRIARGWNPS